MKILTVANHKGGVSKSTTIQILAPYAACVIGLKVLIIDMDEQANLSLRYIGMRKNDTGDWIPLEHPEAKEILEEDPHFVGYSSITDLFRVGLVYPYPTKHENLTLLPPHGGQVKKLASIHSNEEIQACLYNFFKLPDVQDQEWDIVIIDTPPSLGALTLSAIRAATHVLIPAILETKCLEGLQGVLAKVNMENRKKPPADKTVIAGILPTQYKKNQIIHERYFEEFDKSKIYSPLLIRSPMYDRSDIRNMDERIKEQIDLPPISPFDKSTFQARNRRECEEWCQEILERVLGKDFIEQKRKDHEREMQDAS